MTCHHPIIYVRGFAATQGEIEETVADPYMGFNIGSTKSRRAWNGDIQRYFFESPLVRLMGDHQYTDAFVEGEDLLMADKPSGDIAYRSIIIYRYYDQASEDFGNGQTPPIEHFAKGLSELILKLRDKVCANTANAVTPDQFRVHLVAHSMGGLICRAFLQNKALGSEHARQCVDKLFTYATPHNGIDLRVVRNIPGWLSIGDVNTFNRDRMANYLALPPGDDVSVVTGFPPERIFNLVGTNSRDYSVMKGLSAWAAGDASDGLVRLENATTHGEDAQGERVNSPRAFVHRSHSGPYGVVNSEEGYQNLTRFLFGSVRVDGVLHVDHVSLPPEVEIEKKSGKSVKASYQFEVAVGVRGSQWHITRREARENSAIFRTYEQLFPVDPNDGRHHASEAHSPHLFSVFLDPKKSVDPSGSVSFGCDLKVLVPDYTVDGSLFLKRQYEGGYLLRQFVLVEAIPATGGEFPWVVRYGFQSDDPGKPHRLAALGHAEGGGVTFEIPLEQNTSPGMKARLVITARPWS